MTPSAIFRIISDDSDCYKIGFTLTSRSNRELLLILSRAIDLRLDDLLQKSIILTASTRTDLFEPFDADSGYVRINALHVSSSALSLEGYLYNANNHLKGKASHTFFLEQC